MYYIIPHQKDDNMLTFYLFTNKMDCLTIANQIKKPAFEAIFADPNYIAEAKKACTFTETNPLGERYYLTIECKHIISLKKLRWPSAQRNYAFVDPSTAPLSILEDGFWGGVTFVSGFFKSPSALTPDVAQAMLEEVYAAPGSLPKSLENVSSPEYKKTYCQNSQLLLCFINDYLAHHEKKLKEFRSDKNVTSVLIAKQLKVGFEFILNSYAEPFATKQDNPNLAYAKLIKQFIKEKRELVLQPNQHLSP